MRYRERERGRVSTSVFYAFETMYVKVVPRSAMAGITVTTAAGSSTSRGNHSKSCCDKVTCQLCSS